MPNFIVPMSIRTETFYFQFSVRQKGIEEQYKLLIKHEVQSFLSKPYSLFILIIYQIRSSVLCYKRHYIFDLMVTRKLKWLTKSIPGLVLWHKSMKC